MRAQVCYLNADNEVVSKRYTFVVPDDTRVGDVFRDPQAQTEPGKVIVEELGSDYTGPARTLDERIERAWQL